MSCRRIQGPLFHQVENGEISSDSSSIQSPTQVLVPIPSKGTLTLNAGQIHSAQAGNSRTTLLPPFFAPSTATMGHGTSTSQRWQTVQGFSWLPITSKIAAKAAQRTTTLQASHLCQEVCPVSCARENVHQDRAPAPGATCSLKDSVNAPWVLSGRCSLFIGLWSEYRSQTVLRKSAYLDLCRLCPITPSLHTVGKLRLFPDS